MDAQEIRNLQEAYLDVYSPQENIEEGLRSAVKRLLGGGKKEAEAPKPESRGEQLRKKYNVGPEKSDTSAKRQILDRSRARAEKDEKDYGDKPFQKQVANQSKAAHDRYLKAGYSKYGADDARGSGNKARKRAASLNKEQVDLYDIILSHLLDEGYAETPEAAEVIMVNMSEDWRESIVEAPGEWFGGLKDKARESRASQIQSMQPTQKPLPSGTSPFSKPASKNDSGKLTTYGAGGGAAAERAGQTRDQVMRQGAINRERKNKPQVNPGPDFGR
jgi:hypothetical protein